MGRRREGICNQHLIGTLDDPSFGVKSHGAVCNGVLLIPVLNPSTYKNPDEYYCAQAQALENGIHFAARVSVSTEEPVDRLKAELHKCLFLALAIING